jgi:hypothetical protein
MQGWAWQHMSFGLAAHVPGLPPVAPGVPEHWPVVATHFPVEMSHTGVPPEHCESAVHGPHVLIVTEPQMGPTALFVQSLLVQQLPGVH